MICYDIKLLPFPYSLLIAKCITDTVPSQLCILMIKEYVDNDIKITSSGIFFCMTNDFLRIKWIFVCCVK